MRHFFLERRFNPKNFCCLGQSSISKGGPSKKLNTMKIHIFLLDRGNRIILS
jgi:hypothetical protein